MKHTRFPWHRPAWLAVVLLAGILLAATTMAAARPNTSDFVADVLAAPNTPGGIEGVLFEPNGTTPVEGGWIDIHDMGGQPWMGTNTDPGGYFAIPNLPPGEYVLEAHPPPGNPFAASLPVVVEVFPEQWSMTALQLTDIRIDGYVRDCDAEPELRIEGAAVV
ncbi:MAG: carboxypeptidase regulatory-like domain-containing protein, partial [Chloroflexi bacterium]|nr:carboxypeptidase regulatory-like domain-containing protein [Chloroflexota bacterium]